MVMRFVFALGFVVALATSLVWGPLVGLTPSEAFAWTIIVACGLWLAWHVVEFVRICITGGD